MGRRGGTGFADPLPVHRRCAEAKYGFMELKTPLLKKKEKRDKNWEEKRKRKKKKERGGGEKVGEVSMTIKKATTV